MIASAFLVALIDPVPCSIHTIGDTTVKRCHYDSHEQLEGNLDDFGRLL